MARERVALTDKEEKILIQAQLMGLSTGSMIKIGNRLKALELERDRKAEINQVVSEYTYKEKADKKGWEVTEKDGKVWHFTNKRKTRKGNWSSIPELYFDITVEKPGTRFHLRVSKAQRVYISDDWGPAKLMPENNKELYAILRGIFHQRFNKVLESK